MSYTCPRCGAVSHNPNDEREGWCARCHRCTDGARVAELVRAQGYPVVRVLPDDSVAAIMPLLTTTSVILGCTEWGYARRYCFTSPALALQRFAELQSEDDEPEGYIAKRPEQ